MSAKTALIMAGGTGGHIFPGLAVAEALRERGWCVHWLGGPDSMESRLVPPRGFTFETVDFSGVRGKGLKTLFLLPLRLLKAFWQSLQVVRRVQPDVVVGLGGYITFPAGMMAVLLGKPHTATVRADRDSRVRIIADARHLLERQLGATLDPCPHPVAPNDLAVGVELQDHDQRPP